MFQLISEPITPTELADSGAMKMGEPALPSRFTWRERECVVARVRRAWKGYAPEGHAPGNELYLRRHWFEIETTDDEVMQIYCERQARNRRKPQQRWWLYALQTSE